MSLLFRQRSKKTTAVATSSPHGSLSGPSQGLIREGTHPAIPIPVESHDQQPSKAFLTPTLIRGKTVASLFPQSKSFPSENSPIGYPGAAFRPEQTQPAFNSGATFPQPQITASSSTRNDVISHPSSVLPTNIRTEPNDDFPERFDVDDDDTDLAPTVPLSPWEDIPHATRLMRRALRKGIKVRDFGFKPDDERHYGKVEDWLWKLGYRETGLGENWKMEFQPRLPWEQSDPSFDKEKENAEEGKGMSPKKSKEKHWYGPMFHLSMAFPPQALTEKLRGIKRERSVESEERAEEFRSPKKIPKLELRRDGEDVVMRSPRDGEIDGLESG